MRPAVLHKSYNMSQLGSISSTKRILDATTRPLIAKR